MSRKRFVACQDTSRTDNVRGWHEVIDRAGVMFARSDDQEKRKRLEAAIRWFRHRAETGAPYPMRPIKV